MKPLSSSESAQLRFSVCPPQGDLFCGNEHIQQPREEAGLIVEKKRRLNPDQVKALEENFEMENKLEPERKAKLAEEVGLQPRQVAIWFQNRRARCKTKQLERDYSILKAGYDSLKLSFDGLKQERESLVAELNELKVKLHQETTAGGDVKEESHASESSKDAKHVFSSSGCTKSVKENPDSTSSALASSFGSWLQVSDWRATAGRAYPHPHPNPHHHHHHHCNYMRMEEHQYQGGLMAEESRDFLVDQAPTVHWYFSEQEK